MTGNAGEIAVLLCTFNGGRFLADQLASITLPAGFSGHIYVSDDGSSDNTLGLLSDYAGHHSGLPLTLRSGPAKGPCANFLSLLCAADVQGDYFALCDQDDQWDSDKLSRAVTALRRVNTNVPALYCSRTRSLSSSGEVQGLSPLFSRPPAFANALVQNIAGGNTMVLNAGARQLLMQAGPVDVVMHDWWAYLLVSGAGGNIIYDPRPSLGYRQHDTNVVGANRGLRARYRRYLKFLDGRHREWNARNLEALRRSEHLLTPHNRELLKQFEQVHGGSLLQRIAARQKGGFYAQTMSGNIGLLAATLLKKI